MNKILCNSVEYVFLREVNSFENGIPVLNTGVSWKKLQVLEKPVYSTSIEQSDAGVSNKESISAVTRYNQEEPLLKYSQLYVILRLKTDQETFIVGSENYPVLAEIDSDKIESMYHFSRTSA